MDWTVFKLLAWTEGYFEEHDIDSPRLTAEILLGYCLGVRRLDLYLQHDRPLEKPELDRFKSLIKRRREHEPVAYITGEKGFFESRFKVGPGVLIPRPDTETLVETAVSLLAAGVPKTGAGAAPKKVRPRNILELGVGSGAIIVSLAKSCPGNRFFASDISDAALFTARRNAVSASDVPIRFFQGAWLAPLRRLPFFDLIVSNPPYVRTGDMAGLAPEIRGYEPRTALDGGADGLDCIREIIRTAGGFLKPSGHLLLEIGFDQKPAVADIAGDFQGFASLAFIKDLAGHDRVAHLKKEID